MSEQEAADLAKRIFEDFVMGKSVAKLAVFHGVTTDVVEGILRGVLEQLNEQLEALEARA